MKLKKLLLLLITFSILVIVLGGGYFVLTQKRRFLFEHTPLLYWNTESKKKLQDADLPQVSGKVIEKESNNVLVINSVNKGAVRLFIPSDIQIFNIGIGLEEKISFEEISNGRYILAVLSDESFYEDQETAKKIFVSESPIFSKLEKYEAN